MAIDVIIPVRNGARHIEGALASVLFQTHPVQRLIVVDDGSTDDTAALLDDLRTHFDLMARQGIAAPYFDIITNKDNRGLGHARNLGLKASDADLVAFLDSDDVWLPSKLAKQVRLFDNPIVGFVYCYWWAMDEGNRSLLKPKCELKAHRGRVFPALLRGNVISGGSAIVVRRELMLAAGGFDETLPYGEDWDAWLRLSRMALADVVPEPLVGIRIHEGSMQRPLGWRKRWLTQLKILNRWALRISLVETMDAYARLAWRGLRASV